MNIALFHCWTQITNTMSISSSANRHHEASALCLTNQSIYELKIVELTYGPFGSNVSHWCMKTTEETAYVGK